MRSLIAVLLLSLFLFAVCSPHVEAKLSTGEMHLQGTDGEKNEETRALLNTDPDHVGMKGEVRFLFLLDVCYIHESPGSIVSKICACFCLYE